jgi:hypothetical protein
MSDELTQTVEALAPVVIAVASAADPRVAAITTLAPMALNFLQAAAQLQAAGAMSETDLAALFSTIGQGVATTHNAWVAMNKPA